MVAVGELSLRTDIFSSFFPSIYLSSSWSGGLMRSLFLLSSAVAFSHLS